MKVKDIMTKDVVSVGVDNEMAEVAKILTEKRIHGVPVVEEKKVIGIITETDFFVGTEHSLYLPSFIEFVKKFKLSNDTLDFRKNELKNILKAKAADIMTNDCVTIDPEGDIEELFEIFKKRGFHTVPVVDGNKNLCGIVTLADVIALAKF